MKSEAWHLAYDSVLNKVQKKKTKYLPLNEKSTTCTVIESSSSISFPHAVISAECLNIKLFKKLVKGGWRYEVENCGFNEQIIYGTHPESKLRFLLHRIFNE